MRPMLCFIVLCLAIAIPIAGLLELPDETNSATNDQDAIMFEVQGQEVLLARRGRRLRRRRVRLIRQAPTKRSTCPGGFCPLLL